MNREVMDSILKTVRQLSPDERIALADEVDRLAWRDRVQVVLDNVRETVRQAGGPPSDDEIDTIVDQVRAEKSLYERYWIHRRSSAPSSPGGSM